MAHLTDQERDTLNAAAAILLKTFQHHEEYLMLSFHGGNTSISTTYFTPNKVQHSALWDRDDKTFARKIEMALELRADEDGRADEIKAAHIATLRKQLLDLTGEAA